MDRPIDELYRRKPVHSKYHLSADKQLLREGIRDEKKQRVSSTTIKKYLSSQDEYTLNRNVYRKFPRNHYFINNINDMWQIDLIDLSSYSQHNDDFRYILTCVDALSKFGFARALRSKSARNVTDAFHSILNSGRGKPKILMNDKGGEFLNKIFRDLLTRYGIKQMTPHTTSQFKASLVEIFNRTLQTKIQRYFTSKGINFKRYIDVLPDIIDKYNATKNSRTKMAPVDIQMKDLPYVYANLHRKHRGEIERKSQHLQEGEYVRVVEKRKTFQPTLSSKWSNEVFIVTKVINKKPYKLYKLKDLNGRNLNGKFYDSELQRIHLHSNFILKVLKIDGIGRNKKYYVLKANGKKQWVNELK